MTNFEQFIPCTGDSGRFEDLKPDQYEDQSGKYTIVSGFIDTSPEPTDYRYAVADPVNPVFTDEDQKVYLNISRTRESEEFKECNVFRATITAYFTGKFEKFIIRDVPYFEPGGFSFRHGRIQKIGDSSVQIVKITLKFDQPKYFGFYVDMVNSGLGVDEPPEGYARFEFDSGLGGTGGASRP